MLECVQNYSPHYPIKIKNKNRLGQLAQVRLDQTHNSTCIYSIISRRLLSSFRIPLSFAAFIFFCQVLFSFSAMLEFYSHLFFLGFSHTEYQIYTESVFDLWEFLTDAYQISIRIWGVWEVEFVTRNRGQFFFFFLRLGFEENLKGGVYQKKLRTYVVLDTRMPQVLAIKSTIEIHPNIKIYSLFSFQILI